MTCIEEVPVFADGGWTDVEQIEVPCIEPDDAEYDDPYPYPEFDVVDVDFDRRIH